MVGGIARTATRAAARAEATRAAAHDRAKSPRAVGARRHHAVRLWQSVQPDATQQALEGVLLLARGLGLRALYAAVQLARPVALAGVLGAARACAVADLLGRDPVRGDEAGLCRAPPAGPTQSPPPHPARPGRSDAARTDSAATIGRPPARRTGSA